MLGRSVRDRITGFAGIVTGHVSYISGCNQVLVVPPVKQDGTLAEAQWFDEQRMEITSADVLTLDNSRTPGPDMEPPKR